MVRGRVAGDSVADVGPASVMVGNIVQGNRLASAQGRDMGVLDEDSDNAKKVCKFKLNESLYMYVKGEKKKEHLNRYILYYCSFFSTSLSPKFYGGALSVLRTM